jgi:hypothetical protein
MTSVLPDEVLDGVYGCLDLVTRGALAQTCRAYQARYADATFWRDLLYDSLVVHTRLRYAWMEVANVDADMLASTAVTLASGVPDGAVHLAACYLLSMLPRLDAAAAATVVAIATPGATRRSTCALPFATVMGLQVQADSLLLADRILVHGNPINCYAACRGRHRSYVPSYWGRIAPQDVAVARMLVLVVAYRKGLFLAMASGDVGLLRLLRETSPSRATWKLFQAFAPLAVVNGQEAVIEYLTGSTPRLLARFAQWVVDALPFDERVLSDDTMHRCLRWIVKHGEPLGDYTVISKLLASGRAVLALWFVQHLVAHDRVPLDMDAVLFLAAQYTSDIVVWLRDNVPAAASLIASPTFLHAFTTDPRYWKRPGSPHGRDRVVRWLVQHVGVVVDVDVLAWALEESRLTSSGQARLFPLLLDAAGGCPDGAERRLLERADRRDDLTLLVRCANVRRLWTYALYLDATADRIELLRSVDPPCPLDATVFTEACAQRWQQACEALLHTDPANGPPCPVDVDAAWHAVRDLPSRSPFCVWLTKAIGPRPSFWNRRHW